MPRAMFILGLGLLGIAWLGPLPELARHSFAAHMTMHVLVIAVAAPALALGLAGGRFDPVRRAPALFLPVPASLLELVVVWAWHAPALHHAARTIPELRILEQAGFLAAGLLVWLAAFGGGRASRRERAAGGIAGLLLTSTHMTLLGVLLALAPRPLYMHAAVPGFSRLDDQHLGGVLMLAFGGAAYLAGGLYLLAGLIREERKPAAAGPAP